jgi:hypothetical protein
MLGTAAATGSLNGAPTQLLERGTKVLRSTPELSKITDSAQRLLEVGQAAAMSAINSRIESIGETVEGRAKRVTDAGAKVSGLGKDKEEPRGRSRESDMADEEADEDEEEYADDQEYDDSERDDERETPDDDEESAEATPERPRRASGERRPVSRGQQSGERRVVRSGRG